MLKRTAIIFSFILSLWECFAQTDKPIHIDGTYTEQPSDLILRDIGARYGIQIFIPSTYTHLPSRSIHFQHTPLKRAIYQTLKGTDFGFIIYKTYAIIVAPKEIIEAEYESLTGSGNAGNTPRESQSIIIPIGSIRDLLPSGKAEVQGQILDAYTNQPIDGARIFQTDDSNTSIQSNREGKFLLTLPTGKHQLHIQHDEYETEETTIQVFGNGSFSINLIQHTINLDEVIIAAEATDANVSQVQMGVAKIDVKAIKKLPAVMGEPDLVKSLVLQPGVSNMGEGAGGFNVRGGNADQNLILQDGGLIFNSTHALGFYSTFNADLLHNITLYKGTIPAQFGGRLASVLDVEMRDGHFDQFKLKGGLGLVASRLSVEGPVVRGKSSFIAGIRSTYSDWILNRVNVPELNRSSVSFYDVNVRYTHRFNPQNSLILSFYATQDDFAYNQAFGFKYQTLIGQAIYRSVIHDKLFSHLSFSVSQFDNEHKDLDGVDAALLQNGIHSYKLKEQLTYHPTKQLTLDLGIEAILYHLPGQQLLPGNPLSVITPRQTESEKGVEGALFFQSVWKINDRFQLSGGLRFNAYSYLGEKTIFQYSEGYPYQTFNQIGEDKKAGVINHHLNLAPRLSLRYMSSSQSSLKFGYSRMNQYINQLFNSNTPTPISHWQLSTPYVLPQQAHNVSLGYFMNFDRNSWESSIELFGRYMDRAFDYKNFAELILNDHIETELRQGIGRAYGLEVSLKKTSGQFNGSLGYTLSRSERQIDEINRNQWYPADIDRTHDLSIIANYSYNSRNTLTINFNYQTGRPTTPPVGNFIGDNGLVIPIYTTRNQQRIPAYHRLDIAYTVGMGHNKTRKLKASWTFSIYNIYGRRNAFAVYFTQQPFRAPKAYQFSVLGSAFPSVSFNIETF